MNDLATINNELRLKDIERLSKIIEERLKSRVVDKTKKAETDILVAVLAHLETGKWISDGDFFHVLLLSSYFYFY